ncbi:glycosyltransferase family 4 protein [Vibrio alginolyticus]|nr:glycosyltransferase family 4 protein [Vibrio alginolyticus]
MSKIKIAFIHNNCKDFRYPVFKKLQENEKFEVDFFLLDKPVQDLNNCVVLDSIRIPLMQDFVIPIGLYSNLKKKQYDFVISTDLGYVITYVGFLYSRLKGCKFVLWNEQWTNVHHPRRYLTRFIERLITKHSHKILAFGRKHGKFVCSLGAKPESIIYAPNAVPYENVIPEQEDYIQFSGDEKYILCLARLLKIKGHESLIRAFSSVVIKYPNYRLIIAGEGKEYEKLYNLVEELNLKKFVHMPNTLVTNEQKFKLMQRASIFVLPSIQTRVTEAWGLVVNEAAINKKPIIVSSATGAADELIEDMKSGLVFKQNNHLDLADKINYMIENDEFANEMGAAAFSKIESYYNIRKLTEKLESCFYE